MNRALFFGFLSTILLIFSTKGFEYQSQAISYTCPNIVSYTDSFLLCQTSVNNNIEYTIVNIQNPSNIAIVDIDLFTYCQSADYLITLTNTNLLVCSYLSESETYLATVNLLDTSQVTTQKLQYNEYNSFSSNLWVSYNSLENYYTGSIIDTDNMTAVCQFSFPDYSNLLEAFAMTSSSTAQFVFNTNGSYVTIIDCPCDNSTCSTTNVSLEYNEQSFVFIGANIFQYENESMYFLRGAQNYLLYSGQFYETQITGNIVQLNQTNFVTWDDENIWNNQFTSTTTFQTASELVIASGENDPPTTPVYTYNSPIIIIPSISYCIIANVSTLDILSVQSFNTTISATNGSTIAYTDPNYAVYMYNQDNLDPVIISSFTKRYSVYPYDEIWILGVDNDDTSLILNHFSKSTNQLNSIQISPQSDSLEILAASNTSGSLCYAMKDSNGNFFTYFNGQASKSSSDLSSALCTSSGVTQLSGQYYKFSEELYGNLSDSNQKLNVFLSSTGSLNQQFDLNSLSSSTDFETLKFIPVEIDSNNIIQGFLLLEEGSQPIFMNQEGLTYSLPSPLSNSNYLFSTGSNIYFEDSTTSITYQVNVQDWTISSDDTSIVIICVVVAIVVLGLMASFFYARRVMRARKLKRDSENTKIEMLTPVYNF